MEGSRRRRTVGSHNRRPSV